MSDSDTPRTDEAAYRGRIEDCIYEVVHADDARELERELTAARAELAENESVINVWRGRTERAEAEVEALQRDYGAACKLVADMHAAATGRPGGGPRLGVVEDVAAVRADAERYRWLRDNAYEWPTHGAVPVYASEQDERVAVWIKRSLGHEVDVDAAIDAALAKEKA